MTSAWSAGRGRGAGARERAPAAAGGGRGGRRRGARGRRRAAGAAGVRRRRGASRCSTIRVTITRRITHLPRRRRRRRHELRLALTDRGVRPGAHLERQQRHDHEEQPERCRDHRKRPGLLDRRPRAPGAKPGAAPAGAGGAPSPAASPARARRPRPARGQAVRPLGRGSAARRARAVVGAGGRLRRVVRKLLVGATRARVGAELGSTGSVPAVSHRRAPRRGRVRGRVVVSSSSPPWRPSSCRGRRRRRRATRRPSRRARRREPGAAGGRRAGRLGRRRPARSRRARRRWSRRWPCRGGRRGSCGGSSWSAPRGSAWRTGVAAAATGRGGDGRATAARATPPSADRTATATTRGVRRLMPTPSDSGRPSARQAQGKLWQNLRVRAERSRLLGGAAVRSASVNSLSGCRLLHRDPTTTVPRASRRAARPVELPLATPQPNRAGSAQSSPPPPRPRPRPRPRPLLSSSPPLPPRCCRRRCGRGRGGRRRGSARAWRCASGAASASASARRSGSRSAVAAGRELGARGQRLRGEPDALAGQRAAAVVRPAATNEPGDRRDRDGRPCGASPSCRPPAVVTGSFGVVPSAEREHDRRDRAAAGRVRQRHRAAPARRELARDRRGRGPCRGGGRRGRRCRGGSG